MYLFGSRFIIHTDCLALTVLNGKPVKKSWDFKVADFPAFWSLEEQIMVWRFPE